MKISKTQINERMKRKTNPSLAQAIYLAKKHQPELAKELSLPTRRQAAVNLDKINAVKGDSVIVAGKVLGMGEITRKMKIYALNYSESAKEKLKKAGCEMKTILEGLKSLKKGDKLKGEIIK